jgi:hypothetical protein
MKTLCVAAFNWWAAFSYSPPSFKGLCTNIRTSTRLRRRDPCAWNAIAAIQLGLVCSFRTTGVVLIGFARSRRQQQRRRSCVNPGPTTPGDAPTNFFSVNRCLAFGTFIVATQDLQAARRASAY